MPLGFHGSPPHLLAHSSGCLICVYCNRGREETDPGSGKTQRSTTFTGFGQRAMISWDEGCSWYACRLQATCLAGYLSLTPTLCPRTYDYVLRKDGVDTDLGCARTPPCPACPSAVL